MVPRKISAKKSADTIATKEKNAEPKNQKNVFLFHGENVFSATAELNRWREKFIKKHGDSDLDIFENADADKISAAVLTSPFLSEKRLVIIKNSIENFTCANAEKETKKLISTLNKTPESTVIVFFEDKEIKLNAIYKKIREIGEIKLFKIFTEFELQNFIKKHTAALGGEIRPDATNYLIQMTHSNSWTIEKELEKLTTYCLNREITTEDIDLLITPSLETSIFRLTDLIAEKRMKEATNIFRILVSSGEDTSRIFAMIVRHFRLLILACDLKNQNLTRNQIFQKFKIYDPKMHPYPVGIYTDKAAEFNIEELKKIYGMLLRLDADQKTGRIKTTVDNKTEAMLTMEKLIIKLCR